MQGVFRRSIDVASAVLALVLLGPLLAAIAVAVRGSMGSPVLFRQVRSGLHGRPFTLVKFRTMTSATAPGGEPLPDGQRLTPLGRFLRRTSLDELPQFWNVLRGEMSLVGPRPLLPQYLPLYSTAQARRHDVKPGLTGWAQVNGRNGISWEDKFRLDVWYVDHQSLWLDLRILLLTVRKVLLGDGVNQSRDATMQPFRGSVDSGVGALDEEEMEYAAR